jgi:hypothetical protein
MTMPHVEHSQRVLPRQYLSCAITPVIALWRSPQSQEETLLLDRLRGDLLLGMASFHYVYIAC